MNIKPPRPPRRKLRSFLLLAAALAAASVLTCVLVANDQGLYRRTIARVTAVRETTTRTLDKNENRDILYHQQLTAVILNGAHQGETLQIPNTASYSQAYDLRLKIGDEVFISTKRDAQGRILSAQVVDLKRDRYMAQIAVLFFSLVILVGGRKGLRSVVSIVVNCVIFSLSILLYMRGWNLMLLTLATGVVFVVLSVTLVCGRNRVGFSAAVGTLASIALTMLLTAAVIAVTKSRGIHYDQLGLITHSPEQVFLTEILIGTLGGIMDIAVTLSSSLAELRGRTPGIDRRGLIRSGMEVGKDIMGTMTNTLFFAYLSGSMPMVLLWLKNGYSLSTIFSLDLNLEIIRALVGSIGIVVSIPLSLTVAAALLPPARKEVRP